MQKTWQPKEYPKEVSKLEKFLKFDNLCLKFDAFWDDRDTPSGDIHNLIIYYYLCDDTIQIMEVFKHKRPTVFYKRLKLPKVYKEKHKFWTNDKQIHLFSSIL